MDRTTAQQERVMSDFVHTMDSEAMYFFCYAIFGLFVLSYVLKLVEWAIFEKKW